MSRLRKLLRARQEDDLLPGDFVRRLGARGVGFVESVDGDHATIAWGMDRRDVLPLAALRRVRQRGASLDHRQVR